jgi:flagellar biosynthesis protein FlhF
MEVKKFEAPTLQEALETIKRELGPEAIILQTKKNKRGFGLMSKASVEVTAAVSERSIGRKRVTEARLPEKALSEIQKMPAYRQADVHEKLAASTRDEVKLSSRPRTAVRYADIAESDDVATIAKPTVRAQAQVAYGAAPAAPAAQPAAVPAPVVRQDMVSPMLKDARLEIDALKQMVEELKSQQATQQANKTEISAFGTPALQEAFDQLVVQGVDKRFALALIRQAGFELGADRSKDLESVLDQVAEEIMCGIQTGDALEGIHPGTGTPTVMALVGPTGVGKTTTLAKVAALGIRKGLRVGLINLDYVKSSAFEQLATFARVLNLPFRAAHSVDDLSFAIRDFSTLDLILVDTTGRSQRDPEALKEIHSMLATIPSMRTLLVLSATTRDAEMYDMASRFAVFRPQGLVFSKLDETTLYGAIYNVPQKVRLPLLYFTTGQKVPDDIEQASAERVVALVMDL